jgi:DNA polymerase I-like protein with 3'-5' exonuclease and polymerase domains
MCKAVCVDIESFYSSEYSLSKMSTYQYVHDSRFDAYLVAIHNDDIHWVGHPKDFDWNLIDGHLFIAHNVSFDKVVVDRLQELGIIPAHIKFSGTFDTADLAAYLGSKRDLKSASKNLLGREMSKAVRSNMKGKSYQDVVDEGQESLDALTKYGGDDAVNSYDLWKEKRQYWPEHEQLLSQLNFEMSQFGMHVDIPYLKTCVENMERQIEVVLARIPWVQPSIDFLSAKHEKPFTVWEYLESKDTSKNKETGEKNVQAPLSPIMVRKWGEAAGIPVPASLAKTNEDWIKVIEKHKGKHDWLDAIGTYRSLNAHYKKAKTILDGVRTDGTFCFQLKYWGGHTGRFSGGSNDDSGGKFNPQNQSRVEMFGWNMRKTFIAPPGYKLGIIDYSQVEARVLLWLAGDTEITEAIEKEGNLYQAYAKLHGIYKGSGSFKKEDPDGYQITKSLVLGAGFQLSALRYMETVMPTGLFDKELLEGAKLMEGLDTKAAKKKAKELILDSFGVSDLESGNGYHGYIKTLIAKVAPEKVLAFLRAKKDIDQYRADNPRVVRHWKLHQAFLEKSAVNKDPTHEIALRSGRILTYYNPTKVGREIKAQFEMNSTYYFLHSGVATNNEVQATARDIMRDAWIATHKAGKRVLLSVHDELVFLFPEATAEAELKECMEIMKTASPWAAGCPIDAEGALADCYTK